MRHHSVSQAAQPPLPQRCLLTRYYPPTIYLHGSQWEALRHSLSGRRKRDQVNKEAKLPERSKKYEGMNLKESPWRAVFCHQTPLLLAVGG